MMPDPDPRSKHDPNAAATRLEPDSDSVVRLPERVASGRPDGDADGIDDETVVDLRAGGARPVAAPAPGADGPADGARATDAGDATDRQATAPPPAPMAVHRPEVARRILRSLVPAAVALVVTMALALGALWQAETAGSAAARASRVADAQLDIDARLEEVWTAVLATVAGGVGQQVSSGEDLLESLGSARAALEVPTESAAAAASAELTERATGAQQRALTVMTEAVESADGDPIELGNELEAIDEAVVSSSSATAELVEELRTESSDRLRASSGWNLSAAVVTLIGVLLAGVAVVAARRRWIAGVDRPIASMLEELTDARHGEERSVDDGRGGGGSDAVVGGYPELRSLERSARDALELARRDVAMLRARAEWDDWARRVLEALELVDDEAAAHAVVERALVQLDSGRPVELLLADRGSNRLRVVASDTTREAPGCPVDSVASCVALRRGQVSTFEDSESINSCPYLRDRPEGPLSAVCVPVTVAARPVGVLHTTGPVREPAPRAATEQLVTISTQLGARLSSLRTLESSRHDASTDGLTGLPNRRTLEAGVADLLERGTPFIMVLADLDKFKVLNDNFGHEVGDKALQLFAGVLRDNVRGNDLVARLGGEEFVLVYPTMTVETSIEAIGRLRAALAGAISASTVPPFTCSFGIAHSSVAADGDAILRIADAGLLQAKDLGGDQAVVADTDLAAKIFSEDAPERTSRIEPDQR